MTASIKPEHYYLKIKTASMLNLLQRFKSNTDAGDQVSWIFHTKQGKAFLHGGIVMLKQEETNSI